MKSIIRRSLVSGASDADRLSKCGKVTMMKITCTRILGIILIRFAVAVAGYAVNETTSPAGSKV